MHLKNLDVKNVKNHQFWMTPNTVFAKKVDKEDRIN